jgi:hypothetical protein
MKRIRIESEGIAIIFMARGNEPRNPFVTCRIEEE